MASPVRDFLGPLERARALRRIKDARGWSARRIAADLSISPATVTRTLVLLELPSAVQDLVEQGGLSPAAAYEVTKLDDPGEQLAVAEAAVDQKLTRSEVADMVQAVKAKRATRPAKPAPFEVDLGNGMAVRVTWKKFNGVGGLQALRKAVRFVQERERTSEPGAA